MTGDPRPVALITGTISPYRREPFRLLGQDLPLEVLAFEDTGPPIEGLVTRGVTQREAVRLVASGRYRAVVGGLGGRVALPGAYAAARLRRIPFVLWATIWEHPRTPAHRLSWLPTRHLYRHADAVATYGAHVSRYVERHRGGRGKVFVAPQAVDVDHFAAPVAPEDRAAARERAGAARARRCSCSSAGWRPRRASTCCWRPGVTRRRPVRAWRSPAPARWRTRSQDRGPPSGPWGTLPRPSSQPSTPPPTPWCCPPWRPQLSGSRGGWL